MSQVNSEQIEHELKSATADQARHNRKVRSNYWRDLSLKPKLGPFPAESFFFILAVLLFPTYYTLGVALLMIVIYTLANSRGFNFRQLFYFIQSFLRGRKMTRNITTLGYRIR